MVRGRSLPGFAPFVRQHRGELHARIDMEALARSCRGREPKALWVDDAFDLWSYELLRARWLEGWSHAAVPGDVFVWADGEAPDRRLTKIGGLPFLPSGQVWPRGPAGPMTFVAQFGFGDSKDITGRLPGDVLLVFAPDEIALLEPERLELLWSKASRRPIAAEDAPVTGWRLGPVFGVRHRTCDVSGAFPFMSGVEHALTKLMPECRLASTWRIPVMQATKIGGLPYDAQTNEPTPPPGHRFLCQLSSVGPGRRSWSRVNRRRPRRGGSDDCLMIGDAGSISFWIDRKGRVRADASCS